MDGIDVELVEEALSCYSSADMKLIHRSEVVDMDAIDGFAQLLNPIANDVYEAPVGVVFRYQSTIGHCDLDFVVWRKWSPSDVHVFRVKD